MDRRVLVRVVTGMTQVQAAPLVAGHLGNQAVEAPARREVTMTATMQEAVP